MTNVRGTGGGGNPNQRIKARGEEYEAKVVLQRP